MQHRVFITGIGIISALGDGKDQTRQALVAGNSGIKKAELLASKYRDDFPFGEIPFTSEVLKDRANIADEKGISRTEILATIAVNQAIADAKLSADHVSNFGTAFISGSTVGGMSQTENMYYDASDEISASEFLSSYTLGEHTKNIMRRLKMKGVSSTFNTACSSSANAIMYGAKLIKSGRCDRAIVGGADALAKYTVNGFNSLQILSDELCRPFDQNRKGLNLGEGAAYLILESEEIVGDKKIYGEVTGYGNANDAYHASSISDDAIGIIKSISGALKSANLDESDIDYINAHGTGTINNDIAEETGMNKVFSKVPPFQSTKTYTGHTLASSGAIEAVICLVAMANNEIYASLNCSDPIDSYDIKPIERYQDNFSMKHILSNSFGFGGNCSSLIFSKV